MALWKESLAAGFGMNARGAMEIILGIIALENGLINEKVFVSLVIMALDHQHDKRTVDEVELIDRNFEI